MNWQQLLSEKRISDETGAGEKDLRSAFEKDYHRIITSSPFRRLQDKTQVFPLDKSDFIRTRLTHSLEVSSVGRSLAQNIGASIIGRGLDPSFSEKNASDICDILQCAGLIHDIGNPPFGHFGEEAIREWFRQNLPHLSLNGKPVTEFLTAQEYQDLMHFEGNAEGLRMVTKLDYPVQRFGMNLTYGLLSATVKYPTSSLEIDSSSKESGRRKMGHFASEEELIRAIREETGTQVSETNRHSGRSSQAQKGRGLRNPLALILEAADDIAYSTADIEDAFKKGFFDCPTLLGELKLRGVSKALQKRLADEYDFARLSSAADPGEYAVRSWLREAQELLIVSATEGFISHYKQIMAGTFGGELIAGRPGGTLLAALKSIAYDYAFTSRSIFKTEIAANNVLTYLMDILVPAALAYDTEHASDLMMEKYISLLSENYRQVYRNETANLAPERKIYHRILLATDTISGMTDSYASDLARELRGA